MIATFKVELTESVGLGKHWVITHLKRTGDFIKQPTQGPFATRELAKLAAEEFAAKAAKPLAWNGNTATFEVEYEAR